jgi:DtxR family Mn-dependent transcriptional regulator
MPTSTVEDYLKCIFLAQQSSGDQLISTGQIATALGVAPGTATAMVKTLAESGLVEYEPYSGVRLKPAGEKLAAHVLRRHRLIELFLVQVMGMDWSEVHAEAELLEHAVSDRLIERIDVMLGRPEADPHGDPIPSVSGELEPTDDPTLLDCPLNVPVRIVRVTDQAKDFLRLIDRFGLVPGSRISVTARDEQADTVLLATNAGEPVNLGFRAASKILVRPQQAKVKV